MKYTRFTDDSCIADSRSDAVELGARWEKLRLTLDMDEKYARIGNSSGHIYNKPEPTTND